MTLGGHYRSINGTYKKSSPADLPLLIISVWIVPLPRFPAPFRPSPAASVMATTTITVEAPTINKRLTVGSSTLGAELAMEPPRVGYPMLC